LCSEVCLACFVVLVSWSSRCAWQEASVSALLQRMGPPSHSPCCLMSCAPSLPVHVRARRSSWTGYPCALPGRGQCPDVARLRLQPPLHRLASLQLRLRLWCRARLSLRPGQTQCVRLRTRRSSKNTPWPWVWGWARRGAAEHRTCCGRARRPRPPSCRRALPRQGQSQRHGRRSESRRISTTTTALPHATHPADHRPSHTGGRRRLACHSCALRARQRRGAALRYLCAAIPREWHGCGMCERREGNKKNEN
jgi:hypothetical protein